MEESTSKTQNVWVLGGTGFIGSELVNQLRQIPGVIPHMLIHRRSSGEEAEGIRTIRGDLATIDPAWFQRFPPDLVFHLARMPGSTGPTRRMAAARGERANLRLAEILTNLNNPPIVVYVSGSLMYGPIAESRRAVETSPLNPVAFARHYIRAELPWLELRERSSLDIRFTRPGWILGPASWFRYFFWDHYEKYGKVPVYGDGKQWMSIISLDSCAKRIIDWGLQEKVRQDLNVFEGHPVRQQQFSEALADILGCETENVTASALQDNTSYEALTASIPLASVHRSEREETTGTASLDTLFRAIIRELEDE